MNTPSTYRHAIWLAVGLLLCSSLLIAAAPVTTPTKSEGFLQKMAEWQDRMSEKFRDAWNDFRGKTQEKSVATASVDLRENPDNYTVRLNLPGRDLAKVEVQMEDNLLRIHCPAGDKAGRYEQTVELAGVGSGADPKVERRPNDSMIVVTVPKNATATDKESTARVPEASAEPLTNWDRDIFERMERMQREMDRVFAEAFQEYRTLPGYQGFFDEPRFGSSFDVQDEGDRYVVRAYLPDRDMQQVNVTAHNRTLTIEANEQQSTTKEAKTGKLHSIRKAAYRQSLTLPGPVQSDKMTVEKKTGMVIVTLPKAK